MNGQVSVGQVGVVGAGFMGTGIAQSTARAAIPVVPYEPDAARLMDSRERLEASPDRALIAGSSAPVGATA